MINRADAPWNPDCNHGNRQGAKNAAVLAARAARILATNNPDITAGLEQHCRNMAAQVAEKNEALKAAQG